MERILIGLVLLGAAIMIFRYRNTLIRWTRRLRQARRRVWAEDALKHIHNCALRGHPATLDSLAGALGLSIRAVLKLIIQLQTQGWVRSSGEGLSLTSEGDQLAMQVIRAHRLWERYLVDEARMPLEYVHEEAERREHTYSTEQLDALEAAMGYPLMDPHGDPIPNARGEVTEMPGQAVTEWPLDTPATIVHLEDEPPTIFAQIVAQGFSPGQTIWMIEADVHRVVLSDGEKTHTLAPIVAANIFVAPIEEKQTVISRPRLASLKPGQKATVYALHDSLRGLTRRRLMDLGITPGAEIRAEMSSIFQEPKAYRVRGSLIALRLEQTENVLINMTEEMTEEKKQAPSEE